jgi:hypothetical protein
MRRTFDATHFLFAKDEACLSDSSITLNPPEFASFKKPGTMNTTICGEGTQFSFAEAGVAKETPIVARSTDPEFLVAMKFVDNLVVIDKAYRKEAITLPAQYHGLVRVVMTTAAQLWPPFRPKSLG